MLAIKGYFNGREFVPIDKANVKPNQKVIITILDEYIDAGEKIDRKDRLMKTFGSWDDDRDPEDIIKDIYSARASRKEDVSL